MSCELSVMSWGERSGVSVQPSARRGGRRWELRMASGEQRVGGRGWAELGGDGWKGMPGALANRVNRA